MQLLLIFKFFIISCDFNRKRCESNIKINLSCVMHMYECISNYICNFYIIRHNISPKILITHYGQTVKIGDDRLVRVLTAIPFKLIPTSRRRKKLQRIGFAAGYLSSSPSLRFFPPFYTDELIFRHNAQRSCR